MKALTILAALAVASGCTSTGGPTEQEEAGPPEPNGGGLVVVGDDSCRQFKNEAALTIGDGLPLTPSALAPFVRAFAERYPACQEDVGFVRTYLLVLMASGEAETYNQVLREWNRSDRRPLGDYLPMPEPSGTQKS